MAREFIFTIGKGDAIVPKPLPGKYRLVLNNDTGTLNTLNSDNVLSEIVTNSQNNNTGGTTSDLFIQKKSTLISSNSQIGTNIIPAGYFISGIVLQETGGISSAGNINIGTTALGTDVINSEPTSINGVSKPPIGTDFFSLNSTQSLYVSSNSWSGGVLTIYMSLNKILS